MRHPQVVATLLEFDLITEEQAEKAWEEWDSAMDVEEWWWALADVAMQQYRGLWGRTFGLEYRWKRDWIDSVRVRA